MRLPGLLPLHEVAPSGCPAKGVYRAGAGCCSAEMPCRRARTGTSSPVPWMLERMIKIASDIPVLAVATDASVPPALIAISSCPLLSEKVVVLAVALLMFGGDVSKKFPPCERHGSDI